MLTASRNRIENGIAKAQAMIDAKLASGEVTQESVDVLNKKLDMQMDEYCLLQQRKSLAMLEGKISQEEAQTIYRYLGESLETFNRQSVAVKMTISQVFLELLR